MNDMAEEMCYHLYFHRLLPIDNLDLVVVHIIAVNSPTAVNVRSKRTVS